MSQAEPERTPRSTITSGVQGLDDVLGGGLPRNRIYLLQGEPGTGKTTLAMQVLLEGERIGERGLYVTLSESKDELHAVARSHGWSLDQLAIYELSAAIDCSTLIDEENTLYVPAEVELGERIQALLAEVDRVRPARIVLDSCSELRLLAQSALRFRRQVLALKTELIKRTCTVLLLDNPGGEGNDLLQSLVHGVVHTEQLSPLYGAERRRMRVIKLREVSFRGGYHDFTIKREGVIVFPRLVAAEHHDEFPRDAVPSGMPVLDQMLGGGLERGTSALVMGPAGSGKSALAVQYVLAAAQRGERATMFTFDEGIGTLIARARGLGLDLQPSIDSGHLTIQQVDPAELSPGEFVDRVRRSVADGARVLVIDSLNGYLHAMPEEQFMLAQLHELLSYLRQQGLLSLLVVSQHGFLGHNMSSPIDVSYLADSVILTRYFEAGGRVRKALSVVKKRAGKHEDSIRELALSSQGVVIGPALAGFRGILTGVPVYEDMSERSFQDKQHG